MARVLITGFTTGLGKAAAQQLLDDGHDVVLHAPNPTRIASLGHLARRTAGVVIGELADAGDTRALADQAKRNRRLSPERAPEPVDVRSTRQQRAEL